MVDKTDVENGTGGTSELEPKNLNQSSQQNLGGIDSPTGQHSMRYDEMDEEELCEHVHHSNRAPWLRALVLGANDGLVSISALMMGMAAGNSNMHVIRLSGLAGLIAGALSMAVGEYVSVSSQRDAEKADIKKEIEEQLKGPAAQARELEELTQIYVARGVPYDLAKQVAIVLTEKDVIRAHARDELGIDLDDLANPWQAAIVSAICFSSGAAIPFLSAAFLSGKVAQIVAITISATIGLLLFGLLGAWLGGAKLIRGGVRVLLGGWIALAISYGVGAAFDVNIG